MNLADYIALALIVVILGGALLYIFRAKKKGTQCIGCPSNGSCSAKGCCGCQDFCGTNKT